VVPAEIHLVIVVYRYLRKKTGSRDHSSKKNQPPLPHKHKPPSIDY
jgi:hypothetical protein